jgi:hypothetical protein
MSYVPGYEYDVFVSYAHANDQEGWVSTFRQKLEARLKERVPPGATFFHDTGTLRGNDDLTPTLVSGIRGSAVLVMIVSRSYVKSAWCLKECKEFLAANAQRGTRGRIFVVRYDDISPAEFQQFAGEKLGYEFFANDGKYNATLDPEHALFKTRMNELREEIGARLEEFQRHEEPRRPDESNAVEETKLRPAAFIAAPARGLGGFADQLASWLNGFQYDVVRPGDRFYEAGNYESTFIAGLQRSLVFVQLLGRRFDPCEDDRIQSWDQWQFRQAQAAGIPTLRWFNKYDQEGNEIDLDKLDADHRTFVTQNGVWDCDAHRFREIVRTEIETRFHDLRQQQRLSGADGAQPLIVLRADRSDNQFADRIGDDLRKLDCDSIRVPDGHVSSLEEFAADCAANGLLVIYRSCPGKWVLTRLQELRKFLKSDFGRRWACGLWRAPDDEDEALSCSVDGLFVCPQDLQEFVSAVRHRL